MTLLAAWLAVASAGGPTTAPDATAACLRPVYLTFDTGHMGVAPLVAEVLRRHRVTASFFVAAEPTLTGGHSLDAEWAPWWRARAAEGHDVGSHTWSHAIWVQDLPDGRMRLRERSGRLRDVDAAAYCADLRLPAERWREMTGGRMAPRFRAPGGKTSPQLLAAAQACGFTHVGWTPAGFLGDELSSERYPNTELLARALRTVQAGDILLAHLGIHDRKDPWAPAVLEPLIVGLKAKGLCFAPLRDHPLYGDKGTRP